MAWSAEKDMPDLTGKTILVTGGNAGLGYHCARAFLQKNARVVVASRNAEKCAEAVKKLKEETGNDQVEYMVVDLASRGSIYRFCEEYKRRGLPLHVLLNNAGISMVEHAKTEDGFEIQLGTNHFGTFLLTVLLLDVLKSSAPSRVVTTSSLGADHSKEIDWDDIGGKRFTESSLSVYGLSKAYNVMFAYELERRLQGTNVHSFACEPGNTRTELSSKVTMSNKFLLWLSRFLVGLTAQAPEQGILSSLFCATSTELEGKGGLAYGPNWLNYGNTNPWRPSNPLIHDEEARRKLWDKTAELLDVRT
mmetsp:Transcript_7726/g.23394  ORF Transcript_7726/g.23394 Transcript_7726/m.23394 type:complete len:306 (-) Transcript_7726:41-958(-)|eukprot:CAMPEP_0198723438 /NCGR_PEP_ID=MMETSP1475-20131203/934_1 /TAXON_ID= ORGANISM="Unidentified sp., Strain CCMP1999" /NCGR_SAMPLE_ID=MMETSP1475 /ASSEMBLY_ACC=CAM_ASM_001111 /LENGTH=305 /DNA_ID=CAMNT_0044484559 /DNA_START=54 /DNA_END=971 /DNA_ORIENTATION=+